jgi:hypothetical protein
MKPATSIIAMILMVATVVFFTAGQVWSDDRVQPGVGITKHSPVVKTTPEVKAQKGAPSKYRWVWWTLGALVVDDGIAAGAGGGGGGGGDESPPPTTGSATMSW